MRIGTDDSQKNKFQNGWTTPIKKIEIGPTTPRTDPWVQSWSGSGPQTVLSMSTNKWELLTKI
jgi:hypothetical protein